MNHAGPCLNLQGNGLNGQRQKSRCKKFSTGKNGALQGRIGGSIEHSCITKKPGPFGVTAERAIHFLLPILWHYNLPPTIPEDKYHLLPGVYLHHTTFQKCIRSVACVHRLADHTQKASSILPFSLFFHGAGDQKKSGQPSRLWKAGRSTSGLGGWVRAFKRLLVLLKNILYPIHVLSELHEILVAPVFRTLINWVGWYLPVSVKAVFQNVQHIAL